MNTEATLTAHSKETDQLTWRWLEIGLIFGFWTVWAMVITLQRAFDYLGFDEAFKSYQILKVFSRTYIWALLTPLIFWLSRRFSIDRNNWIRRIIIHLAIAVFIAVSVDIITDFIHHYFNSFNPNHKHHHPFEPFNIRFDYRVVHKFIFYMAILFAGFALDYFRRYRNQKDRAIQLQAQLADSKLETLRMQINPHFLFNTLHAISSLVDKDPSGVRRMIVRLSELLRYALDNQATQEVVLKKELQFLDDYIEIQKIRFQEQLSIELDISSTCLNAYIPSLILQPLVENAIKHGTSKIDGHGHIYIKIWQENMRLQITVQDNGPGFDSTEDHKQGVGINNTRARLTGLYGNNQNLVFYTNRNNEQIVHVTIPFHTDQDLYTSLIDQ